MVNESRFFLHACTSYVYWVHACKNNFLLKSCLYENFYKQLELKEQQLRKEIVQEIAIQFFQQQNTKKQFVLLRVITKLVNAKLIEVRQICEHMINFLVYSQSSPKNSLALSLINANQARKNEETKETPTFIWCKILEWLRRLIPRLDYKSCRDIFKIILEAVKRLSNSSSNLPPPLDNEMVHVRVAGKRRLDALNDTNQICSKSTHDIKVEALFEVFIAMKNIF